MARFLKSPKRLGRAQRINPRARKIRVYQRVDFLPPIQKFPGMNDPETRVTIALNELHIRNTPQFSFMGGSYLGGGRMDWDLPDYRINLEYNGPFHDTSGGAARDALRNLGVSLIGRRVEKIYQEDLFNLKPRLLQIVGRRV